MGCKLVDANCQIQSRRTTSMVHHRELCSTFWDKTTVEKSVYESLFCAAEIKPNIVNQLCFNKM